MSEQQLVYWLIKRTLFGVKMPPGRQTCKSHAAVTAAAAGVASVIDGGVEEGKAREKNPTAAAVIA